MYYLFAMNPILIIAAVVPAVLLMIYVYRSDRVEHESRKLLLTLLIWGVISTTFASMTEQFGTLFLNVISREGSFFYNFIMYFIIVACSEEGFKYLVLKLRTWKNPEFNCKFDGVVYAVFVSLGFAVWENLGYVYMYGFRTALVRAVTAVPGHACFGVFMGIWYSLAKQYEHAGDQARSAHYRRLALIVPILVHGAYDFVATMDSGFGSVLFVVFVMIMFLIAFILVRAASKSDGYL